MNTKPKPMRTFTVPATLPSVEEARQQCLDGADRLADSLLGLAKHGRNSEPTRVDLVNHDSTES